MSSGHGLLQTEDILLKTEDDLWTTADNDKCAQVNWSQLSTTLGHQMPLLGVWGRGTSELM